MAEQVQAPVSKFETVTCGRCGGTGRYSFNLMDGDLCYGCLGSGRRYTKRGEAAKEFYEASCSVPAEQIEPGMVIVYDRRKCRVIDVRSSERTVWASSEGDSIAKVEIETEKMLLIVPHNLSIRVVQRDAAERDAKVAQAMQFQASLTKQGKPRKGATR